METRAAQRTRLLALAAGVALLGNQPCGPIPGDALEGPMASEPVRDWSFADAERTCELEVSPDAPHSVTVYCFAGDGVLYVPAIMGESKKWTKLAEADPRARVRVGGKIHPVRLRRIVDPAERLAVARLAETKLHGGEEPPEDFEAPENRWYFEATSR